jgi:hypothetical protein
MRRTLIASPSTGKGGDAERLQIELLRLGTGRRSSQRRRSTSAASNGATRRILLAGVQAGQVGDVVEQAVQRIDVVLQQAEKASRRCSGRPP